tara:strand:+ start:553 stop:873 length:321 start_codon:yes stop_codon:yes gene_type:complete
MKYLTFLLILTGCPVAFEEDMIEAYPIETVSCTHPDSLYEGVVEVEVDDNYSWKAIEFEIRQEESSWSTMLWNPDTQNELWSTRMQLIEMDCNSEYEYTFYYTEEE